MCSWTSLIVQCRDHSQEYYCCPTGGPSGTASWFKGALSEVRPRHKGALPHHALEVCWVKKTKNEKIKTTTNNKLWNVWKRKLVCGEFFQSHKIVYRRFSLYWCLNKIESSLVRNRLIWSIYKYTVLFSLKGNLIKENLL